MVARGGSVIVGIDCATEPARIGLARAEFGSGGCLLTDLQLGIDGPVHEVVGRWLRGAKQGLIALDAPLGWPSLLADMLPEHRAGDRLVGEPNRLFHRLTDDHVLRTIGKNPLEVAADRIARTAHRSLELLDRIRTCTKSDIPLAWTPGCNGLQAIEVYPAATLAAHGLPSSRYKDARRETCAPARKSIVAALTARIEVRDHVPALLENADLLDAGVCVLAALDFLAGECMSPTIGAQTARKEGWIWVKRPAASSS